MVLEVIFLLLNLIPSPEIKKSFPGHDFIKKEVQDVDLALFESLNKNDIHIYRLKSCT